MVRHRHIATLMGMFLFWGLQGWAWSEELSFTASVDKTQVALDGKILLTLTVSASDIRTIKDFSLPDTGSLSMTSTRRKTHSSTSAGKTQSFQVTQLALIPTQPGKTIIGSTQLQHEGKIYKTEPIEIEVLNSQQSTIHAQPPASSGQKPEPGQKDTSDSSRPNQRSILPSRRPKEGIFLSVYLTPDSVVEGQQVTANLVVYANLRARIREIRWPRLDGFFAVDREVPPIKPDYRFVDNILYQYQVLARKALFPLEAGKLQLGSIEVEVETYTPKALGAQKKVLRTKPIQIQVDELPTEGQPRMFHQANVGKYQISASVDANEVNLNGQITYTLKVEGSGNIQLVRPPELPELPRFKIFDPSIKVSSTKRSLAVKGSKIFEYNLVPISSGELVIPSLVFSYFDPEKHAYRTLETNPQTIRVKAVSADAPVNQMVEGHQVNVVSTSFESAIPYDSKLEGFGPPFYRSTLFWPALLFPPVIYLLFIIAGFINTYMHADSQRNRMRKAWSRKQKKLKRANRLAVAEQSDGFYSELKAAMLDGIEACIGLVPQNLTLNELQSAMRQKGVHMISIEALIQELENCDFGRFAPAIPREEEMGAAFKRVKKLLKNLEQEPIRSLKDT